MKGLGKLGIFAVLAFGMALSAPAQTGKRVDDMHACVKCEMASAKAGKCSMCKGATTPIRAKKVYVCTKCKMETNKPGNCKGCKKPMKAMAETYICSHCKTSSSQSGNCKQCGKFRKKHQLKIM